MTNTSAVRYQSGFARRYLVFAFLTVFGYLFQVCAMPYIRIAGVSPNMLFVVIGIITVAYGKLRAFWVGALYGLLMQIMVPSVSYLNLGIYTISTLFCSFPFADKPLKTLEYDRAINRTRTELPAWLRTVLCAMLNTLVYETVNLTYVYITGISLTGTHILRGLLDVLFTDLLALLLAFPVRRLIFGRRLNMPVMKTAPVVFKRS